MKRLCLKVSSYKYGGGYRNLKYVTHCSHHIHTKGVETWTPGWSSHIFQILSLRLKSIIVATNSFS